MLRNFFITAWRSMRRQKGYATLNLVGLTIGISASLLILLYLHQQLSFDQQHEKRDRIVRISSDIAETDDQFRWASSQPPLAPKLEERFPEVEVAARIDEGNRVQLKHSEEVFFEKNCYQVDPQLLEIFTFDFLAGDPATALDDPQKLILSQSLAERIFGQVAPADLLGRTLTLGEDQELQLSGVYADMPKTSHLIPQALYPIHDPEGQMEQPQAWGNFSLYTYALLQPGTNLQAFEDKLAALNQEFVKPIFDQFGLTLKYETLRLSDIHLRSDFQGEPEPTGSMEYIYIFAAIGVFLLVLACINYMNLATARSQRRAREVGVRKTMGAHRSHLISQFLAESLLLALLALGASLLVVYASLPFFNQILDLPLRFAGLWQPVVLLSMLGILLLTGLVAGSYPALYLSGFHPAHVLKGSSGQTTGGNHRLRQGLVVLQFVISLFMLVSTGVVYDQLRFLNQKDLGFSTDPLLKFSISNPSDREKWPVLRHKLLSLPGVENAGTARSLPGMGYNKNLMPIESESGEMVERTIDQYPVDYDYFETMEMEIVQGRNFDRSRGLDSAQAVLVNQAMVRRMGWTDPIGKKVSFDLQGNANLDAEVIGVVRDFHQQSLYEAISALMFTRGGHQRMQVLRIHPSNVEQTLADVQSAWRAVFPTLPFEYEFLDEAFMEQYEAEKHRSQLFTLFSLLTVLIACLGLLGLASFMAEQRTREMGIRKIVGASVPQLMQLMTREFLLLVLVATPIAFGLAWYFMRDWLSEFAYHVDLSVLTFGGALLMTLLITLATTSYHALRAATINPAEALRQE